MCNSELLKRIADLEEKVQRLQFDMEERLKWNDLPPQVNTDFILRELDNLRYATADRNHTHPSQS